MPFDDLPDVVLEISVLGPVEPVADPAEVEVGRHGLIVEQGTHRGLLLPQVPTEWGWDRETFVSETCVKAGLAPDAWRTGARLFTFRGRRLRRVTAPALSQGTSLAINSRSVRRFSRSIGSGSIAAVLAERVFGVSSTIGRSSRRGSVSRRRNALSPT